MSDIGGSADPSFSAIEETPGSAVRRLLFGEDGLRAGWSVLTFGLLVVALGVTANFLNRHFHLLPVPTAGEHEMVAGPMAASEGLNFALLAAAAWAMALLERRPFGRFGLSTSKALPDFAVGLVWGLTMLTLLVGALVLTHRLAFDGILLPGAEAVRSGARWAVAFLFVGLLEEFLFRGYLQYTLTRGVAGLVRALSRGGRHAHAISFWATALIFSVGLFMAGHVGNPGETAAGIAAVGAAGAVLAFALWRTGTLWWAIGFHAAWDWAQSFLYGVPDSGIPAQGHWLASHPLGPALMSGGPDGPEGSLLALPVLGLTALVIHWTLPRRVDALPPPETRALVDPEPQLD